MAQEIKRRMLVMENGSVHEGTGFGSMNDAVCELVFNTSMVGYQEIVTDPQLHRADGGDDLSAHRQLRHHRRGL